MSEAAGAMIAVELVHGDGFDPDAAFTAAVASAAREQGVIVLTCGTYGNVLRFLPPLTISDDLLNRGARCVGRRLLLFVIPNHLHSTGRHRT